MSRINSDKIKKIKERLAVATEDLSQDGEYESMYHVLRRHLKEIVNDANLMLSIIEEIRCDAHFCEDA